MPSTFNKRIGLHTPLGAVIVVAAVVLAQAPANPSSNTQPLTRTVLSHSLPRLDGRNLRVTVLEVNYGPGESAPPHSHPCPVIGYVLEGALRTQMKGEAEGVYKAGETFYEAPSAIHQISANASHSESVRFLVAFVCDHDAPLSIGAAESSSLGASLGAKHP